MSDECIVKGCSNRRDQGKFVGELCSVCYSMLTTEKVYPSGAWFAKRIYDLENRIKPLDNEATKRAIEASTAKREITRIKKFISNIIATYDSEDNESVEDILIELKTLF